MSGLYRLKLPKQIVIPLAVTLRYIPAINEEWHNINDCYADSKFSRSRSQYHKASAEKDRVLLCAFVGISFLKLPKNYPQRRLLVELKTQAPRTILHRTKFSLLDWGDFSSFFIALLGLVFVGNRL